MRFILLHYHIFKNAGTTIEDILDHSFGARFARLGKPVNNGVIANAEIIQYLDAKPHVRALSSHQIRYPRPQAPGYLFFDICFLRDPLDRLRSAYDYYRLKPNPDDPLSDLANRCSLADFASETINHFSSFVRDTQVNFLACAGESNEPGDCDLALAANRMMATSFLGVVDCFDQSAVAGVEALQCAFPELDCASPPANVSRGLQGTVASRTAALLEACGEALFEKLLRMTALDRRLVALARAEVLRRCTQASRSTILPEATARITSMSV